MSLSTSQLVSGGLFSNSLLVASLSHLAKVCTTTEYPFTGDLDWGGFAKAPPPQKKQN